MIVRKKDGSLVEHDLPTPEAVIDSPDPDALMSNVAAIVSRNVAAMQRVQRPSDWIPDKDFTRMTKDMQEAVKSLLEYRDRTSQQDTWLQLSEDEQKERVLRLVKKMGLLPK